MRTPCVPALLVVAAWGLPLAAQAPRGQPSIRALMEAYQAGDYGGVARDLKRVTDLEAFGRKIVSDTWSLRVSRGSAFEPQLVVAAAVALEAVQLHGQAHRAKAAALIEIACNLVRLNEDREEVERLWHWTAVALLEGIADGEALEVHVRHALRRFPDDPAFVMANAVAAELRTFPDSRHLPISETNPDGYRLVIDRLEAALALAANLARRNLRGEAADVAERSLAPGRRPPDPWLMYGQGDLRHHAQIVDRLRSALR